MLINDFSQVMHVSDLKDWCFKKVNDFRNTLYNLHVKQIDVKGPDSLQGVGICFKRLTYWVGRGQSHR